LSEPGAEGRWFSGVARRRRGGSPRRIVRESRRETLGAAEGMSDATGVGLRGVVFSVVRS